jgi:hypothetical protein
VPRFDVISIGLHLQLHVPVENTLNGSSFVGSRRVHEQAVEEVEVPHKLALGDDHAHGEVHGDGRVREEARHTPHNDGGGNSTEGGLPCYPQQDLDWPREKTHPLAGVLSHGADEAEDLINARP